MMQHDGDRIPRLALNARQAARALAVSERTLWALTRDGTIPAVRLGGRVVYPLTLLEQWLIEQARAGNPAAGGPESDPEVDERGR